MILRKISTNISLEVPPNINGLLHPYHDKFLADESLSDLELILLSIYLVELTNKKAGVPYEEIKEVFVSMGRKEVNFKANIYNAKKLNLIEEKKEEIYFLINGLKRLEKSIGQIGKSPVHIIKSGQGFTAIKLFEEFLNTEIKDREISLCDPYISASTLYPFSALQNKIKNIKILTSNLYDPAKFNDYKKKFEKETNIIIEVKVNNKLHDRFLISGEKCWSIGTSIKDLGNKDTMIRELDGVVTSLKELFLERWNEKP